MERANASFNDILSNRESLEQLKSFINMLTADNEPPLFKSAPNLPAGGEKAAFLKSLNIEGLMRVREEFSRETDEDAKNRKLLLALRPFLSEEKQAGIDGAVKVVKLARLLPLIEASGLLA
ncbi:MAG: hypothetical protein LBC56_08800 [Oscillospiraceae bacterium]|jgi:hypothetical protein|nr:hypothetical protein [Oscillospiraceae bacterium]